MITPTEFQKAMQPRIINAWKRYGDGDIKKFACVLANFKHETAHTYMPIREYWGPTAKQRGYEGREDLGNNQVGDGEKFKGRGDIQMTGKRNYTLYAGILGVDLVGNPDLALDPEISAFIGIHGMMNGSFTTKKLSRYINSTKTDFVGARAVVNGTDKAELIAGYANEFLAYLQANPHFLQDEQQTTTTPIATSITALTTKKHTGVYLGIAASLVAMGIGAVVILKQP